MTKRDYLDAAKAIHAMFERAGADFGSLEYLLAQTVEQEFIAFFVRNSPRFDALRFQDACRFAKVYSRPQVAYWSKTNG